MRYFVIAVCSLLLALSFVSDVKAGDTYSNPIYEENFAILWQGRSTTIGIGDPTVISHKNTFICMSPVIIKDTMPMFHSIW